MKAGTRRAVRHVVWLAAHIVSKRPWLVRGAARVLAAFPSLKHRVRRLINEPSRPPSRREESLTPGEARVLVDLRQAIADRQGSAR